MNMGSSPIFRRDEGRPEIIENPVFDMVSGFLFSSKILAKLIKISNYNKNFSNDLVITSLLNSLLTLLLNFNLI